MQFAALVNSGGIFKCFALHADLKRCLAIIALDRFLLLLTASFETIL